MSLPLTASVEETPTAAAGSTQPRKTPADVTDRGFTVLWEGQDPIADIVLIHGLEGHPKETWTYRIPDHSAKSRSTLARLFHRSQHNGSPDKLAVNTCCYWPEDLLPIDFSNDRIATYGYDSRVTHFFSRPSSQTTISGHGRSLLHSLVANRQGDLERPIIFIAHSLGGLILKEALRRSWRAGIGDEDLQSIYNATTAVIFMGTPHRGSPYVGWGIIARNIAVASGFDASDKILRDLQVDSGALEHLREEFGQMLKEERFHVHSFQEAKGPKGMRGLTTKIVQNDSSGLDDGRERKDEINANHMGMCRFSGHTDPEYCKVRNALQRCQNLAETRQKQRLAEQNCLNTPECQDCLDSLEMRSTELRFDQVDQAHKHTLDWLFGDSKLGLEPWLKSGHGLYWIKGKPGSGKSTVMKHLYNDPRTAECLGCGEGEKAKAAFFFHDRGSGMQRSFEGLLHGILFQVLQQIPDLVLSILEVYRRKGHEKWTLPILGNALKAILHQRILKVEICLFIDALDEYEGKHEDVADFLTEISADQQTASTRLKICFSSRPLNIFLDSFTQTPGFALHDQTREDISNLVRSRMGGNQRMVSYLQSAMDDERMQIQRLSERICSRAQGVFLWVKLTLDELLGRLTAGDSIEQLHNTLSAIPDDLEALYQRMLTKIPKEYRKESYTMLQIVQCSFKPLTLHQFTEAFCYSSASSITNRSPCLSSGDYNVQGIKRKIRSRCMGLIEVQSVQACSSRIGRLSSSIEPFFATVQLMHQTVKEYLQGHDTQSLLLDNLAGAEDNGYCNLMKYLLGLAYHAPPMKENHGWIGWRWLAGLIYYATRAEETTERSQAALLYIFGDHKMEQLFQPNNWVNKAELREGPPPPPIKSVLSFAAFAGLSYFLEETLSKQNRVPRPEMPLLHLAAIHHDIISTHMAYSPAKAIRVLFKYGAMLDERWEGKIAFDLLWTDEFRSIVETTKAFLAHGQDPNNVMSSEDLDKTRFSLPRYIGRGYRPLHVAVSWRNTELVRTLLEHGAHINALDSEGKTPLDKVIPTIDPYTKLSLRGLCHSSEVRFASFLLNHGGKVTRDHDTRFSNELVYLISSGPKEDYTNLLIGSRLLNLPRLDAVVPIEQSAPEDLDAIQWLPDTSPSNPGVLYRLWDVLTSGFKLY